MSETTGTQARDEVLAKLRGRKRLTAEYKVVLSSDTVERLGEARVALLEAEAAAEDGDEAAKAALAEARAAERAAQRAVDEDTVTLRFEGLPRDAFRELLDAHQATEEQEAKAEKAGANAPWYDVDRFPNALIAATCVDPGFTSVEEVAELFTGPEARFSQTEAEQAFDLALSTCVGARQVTDWGKGSGETAG